MNPSNIPIGTLTKTFLAEAKWSNNNQYPAHPCYADEIEKLLEYLNAYGQQGRYWPDLVANYRRFESALQEIRISYFFNSKGFKTIRWEPLGENKHKGEYLIQSGSGQNIFVEVKAPDWESELSDIERLGSRKKRGKHINMEGRAIEDPARKIHASIQKAYPMFAASNSNLLVIADNLFVSLEHIADSNHLHNYLYGTNPPGLFTTSTYERLGGVGIFWIKTNHAVSYHMALFKNGCSLGSTCLPSDFVVTFPV